MVEGTAVEEADFGLSSTEAARRLIEVGPNDPTSVRRAAILVQLLGFFSNPLVIILLVASAISAALGELLSAAIIAIIVLLSVALNFFLSYRSLQAAERLRETMAPTATVRRDAVWKEIPRREVVPGDVIRLSPGDLVPADAHLLEAHDLHVQEAALTGESLPVEKHAGDADGSLIYLGTSVVSGTGTAVVTATGRATQFGEIAARLAARPPETEFDRGVRAFGFLIMRTVFFLVLFVVLVFVVTGKLRHNPLESLLFAVALAVGLTPEFLPMITTVTLARGAVRMSRQKVIVKHLDSIENFGSIDVFCSDKTGTLTRGEMALESSIDAAGRTSNRVLALAYLNSLHESGIPNPLDKAIRQAASADVLTSAMPGPGRPQADGYRKVDEIPFDFERRLVSIVVEAAGERWLLSKGAPESILGRCVAVDADAQTVPLDHAARAQGEATYRRLSAEGYRVLAIAFRSVPILPAYGNEDERDLVLAGFLAFSDPPLLDVREVVQSMARDGVRLVIVTGDNELVARHVCAQVGLDAGEVVLGDEVSRMSDPGLGVVAERATIFARVSPAQKHQIILALKRRGHVVGFLGDGINDAPSLRAADVGISVATAVDVARDAADIILLDRSLQALHNGIMEGRRAFGNVMKYLLMGTSSNFGNMFSMAAAAVVLPFLPMLPTQILLNNFLYDLAQVTIPTDNVDATFIVKPRKWDISLIRNFMVYIGPISSLYDFLTFAVLLFLFHASESLFHTGWFVESLATQTLVIFVIRTAGNPLRSRPSDALAATTLLAVLVGLLLPFSPLARMLGFSPLPFAYFLFLVGAIVTYLLLVEALKRRLVGSVLR